MSTRLLLGLALFLSPLAQAKSLKKYSDKELVTVMLNAPKVDVALDATYLLRERRSTVAVPAYAEVCRSHSAQRCEHALSALEDLISLDAQRVVQEVLHNPQLEGGPRRKAAIILSKQNAELLIPVTPELCGAGAPMACQEALNGLRSLTGNAEAQQVISGVVHNTQAKAKSRLKALNIAGLNKFSNFAELTGVALSGYRVHSELFTIEGIVWSDKATLKENGDLLLYMVTDEQARRLLRVKALKVVEKWNHPALPSAYLAMLTDSDKKIRKKSALGLGRAGLPGEVVRPALENVVRTDKKGDVRAAALKSLKFYGHPTLLPLLHQEVMNEKNAIAWGHAMTLLMVLADPSSIPTLTQLLVPSYKLTSEARIMVIQTLVRLNAVSAIPTLKVLASATIKSDILVSASASEAYSLLGASLAEREHAVHQWMDHTEVIINEITVHEMPMPFIDMHFDKNGFALTVNK